jgi:phospholipid transport system substrate-binding protein
VREIRKAKEQEEMMQLLAYHRFCGMVALLSAVMLLPVAVMAEEQGPIELLQHTRDEVLEIVRQDPDVIKDSVRLREIAYEYLLPHVDFMTLSRWVMGKHWRKATPEQRQTFANQFRELLLNNYLRSVTEYRNETIDFMPLRDPNKTKVVVNGIIDQPGGPPVHVDFRMHSIKGEWLVYDVVVEGVSLAVTNRSMFSQKIRDLGIDGVIAELKARNAEAWGEESGASDTAAGQAKSSPSE